MATSLGSAARSGLISTALTQALRVAVQLVSLVALSRMVAPSAFGVFAICLVVVGLAEAMRELGLSSAAIQAGRITEDQQSFLFWLNVAAATVLSAVTCLLAAPISWLYGMPELKWLLVASTVIFIANGAAAQFRARLTRELRFRAIGLVDVTSVLLGSLAGIVAASMGAGVWALWLQQAVTFVCSMLGLVCASRWLPAWRWRVEGRRDLLGVGANFAGIQVVNYVARNADTAALGLFASSGTVGQYSRAFQIISLPISQLNGPATKVAFPVLSRLRDDPARFQRFHIVGSMALVNTVGSLLVFIACFSTTLVPFVLGPGWDRAASLAGILAIAGFSQTVGYGLYWVFLGQAWSGANLRYTLWSRGLLLVAVVAAAPSGATGVAIAFSTVSVLSVPFAMWWLSTRCGYSIRYFATAVLRSLSVCVAAGLAAVGVSSVSVDGAAATLAVGAAVYLACISLAIAAIGPYREDFIQLWKIARPTTTAKV
ncbi:lipopolysaccharide biosynthesis protein [Nocardioides sp.]|uniref:lipopolysaccharide biosynthesis protein n=1 Tax=Nocardioides sp. TaxID=35761 RepID=UPI002623DA0B|nr:lipopolysaccharide biosynthesis protein [Nocardioides sp.]